MALLLWFIMLILPISALAAEDANAVRAAGSPQPVKPALYQIDFGKLPVDSEGNRLVGRVNGRPITEKQFMLHLNREGRKKNLPANQAEAFRAALVAPVFDLLVDQVLIQQYAEEQEIRVSEGQISQGLKKANEDRPAGKKLQDLAVTRGESPEVVRQDIHQSLLERLVHEHIGRDVKPASPEIEAQLKKEFLNQGEDPDVLTSVTEIRARHLVIRAPAGSSTTETAAARSRVEQILEKVRQGMDFGQAVRRYSQDRTTRDLDGDLGYFLPGRMYRAFDKAVFHLQPGQVSEVIETPVGFHLVQVTDRRRSSFQHQWMERQRERRFAEWRENARKVAKVERYIAP